MTAGLDAYMRVWREENTQPDDDVGGAMLTGTVVYECVQCRLTPFAVSQLLLQQGLETKRTMSIITRPPAMVIYERDVVEITAPAFHPNYGQRFRVLDVQRTGIHPADRRGYLRLVAERWDRTRQETQV